MITISQVLSPEALTSLPALIDTLAWRDGAETAGHAARLVKRNSQADLTSRTGARLKTMLESAIIQHPVVRAAAQPREFSRLIISKTLPGGGYGLHVDNAFMEGRCGPIRTDLSFTLFLSEPDSYDGGELVVEQAGETRQIKLPMGDLLLYPATHLHAVNPVTQGERLVCVGWIESHLKAEIDRTILFDLENLRTSLGAQFPSDSLEMLILGKVMANLLRRLS